MFNILCDVYRYNIVTIHYIQTQWVTIILVCSSTVNNNIKGKTRIFCIQISNTLGQFFILKCACILAFGVVFHKVIYLLSNDLSHSLIHKKVFIHPHLFPTNIHLFSNCQTFTNKEISNWIRETHMPKANHKPKGRFFRSARLYLIDIMIDICRKWRIFLAQNEERTSDKSSLSDLSGANSLTR